MSDPREVMSRAAELGGPSAVPMLSDGAIFKLPVFTEDFVSEAWPEVNGPIAMRFPTVGDEVEIERLAIPRGGGMLARMQATVVVCLESAPPCWWRPPVTQGGLPSPAPDRLPCSPDLVAMWSRWLNWRDSFRSGVPRSEG